MHSALTLCAEQARRHGVLASLFPAQVAAVTSHAPLRAYQCDRRAGKTTSAIADFVQDHHDYPRCEYAYVALTSKSARNIAWPIFREFEHEHRLGARMRENLLRVEMPNQAAITLYGADRADWIDRLLGQKLRKVWIDEAAFYTIGLKRLIYEVLQPTVSDLRGQITLMSTPGYVLRGLFHEVVTGQLGGWEVHKWSWRDNPHMRPQVEEMLAREAAGNPGFMDWPSTRRMWFNEWAMEAGARVYHFDAERNAIESYRLDSSNLAAHRFVLGVDFGWTHNTAFAVGCWTPSHNRWVELESYKEKRMEIPAIAARIKMYQDFYPGLRIVVDPAAAREIDELRKRYGLALELADKEAKCYWINQYNADLSAGKVVIAGANGSPHVEEMMDLTWEIDVDGNPIVSASTKELVESRRAENDCCDAALYAYRFSFHHTHVKTAEPPRKGSPAFYDAMAEKMEREAEERYREGDKQW